MKINDTVCGFEVVRISSVDELSAKVFELEHKKSGARLLYLDREDTNMSFAISFATPPCDDTGVCHIIEHSVLCGSEKYPLRDPFAELLKGSLNTFLNAMTYEDKTVYPVSSRCEKDFLNLVDVYLDAVLRPKLLENKYIFMQEGWHYEYDGSSLTRSGVVYNEMKGAYSSPDDVATQELSRALFKDSVYEKDSGGDPEAIPTLTYEGLLDFYKTYYHPSNAKLFLDGSVDLERTLSLIDSHLCRYERKDISVTYEKTKDTVTERTVRYEISESEDATDKVRFLLGYVYSDSSDAVEHIKTNIILDYLSGTNASVLKRELLREGLCHDVMMYTNRAREQTVVIEIRDTEEDKLARIEEVISECLGKILRDGFDKEAAHAALNYVEFKLRERDYGSLPRGIGFALSTLGAWLYGECPEDALKYEDTLLKVREEIECGGLERTLSQMLVSNPHRARLVMLPDKALADERAEREEAQLRRILDTMSEDELKTVVREAEQMSLWQNTEESPEALATLPTLSIEDIPKSSERVPIDVCDRDGTRVLYHDVNVGGISYATLFFDCSDVPAEELYQLTMLSAALVNLDTDKHDALSLQREIKANLGSFYASCAAAENNGVATPYLRISISALDAKKDKIPELLSEVLMHSDFSNTHELDSLLAQAKATHEDSVLSSGHTVALDRAEAYMTSRGAITEYMSGHEAYLKIKEIYKNDERVSALARDLELLLKKLMTRERLTLSLIGERDESLADRIISIFPSDKAPSRVNIAPLGKRREFFTAATKVAYAVSGGICDIDFYRLGNLRVARSILSYEYLWTQVRVSGGAYGAGFVTRRTGFVGFYSYRDPSPIRSLGVFAGSADYLRSLAKEYTDLTKFIIGAIGEYDLLTTPKGAAALRSWNYICGVSDDMLDSERRGILDTNKKTLLAVADLIDGISSADSYCIVGSKEHLSLCEDKIDNILVL